MLKRKKRKAARKVHKTKARKTRRKASKKTARKTRRRRKGARVSSLLVQE